MIDIKAARSGWRRFGSRLALVAPIAAMVWLIGSGVGRADRVIETPSPTGLAASQTSAEDIYGLDRRPVNELWVDEGLQYGEVEGAQLELRGRQTTAVSAEFAILPETQATPSLAVGIRDVFDTTRGYGSVGYSGRSAYLVAGKTLFNTQQASYPIRNVCLTVGLGTGVTNGLFGSASADLGFGLRQTIEFDGRGLNYRVSHPIGSIARIDYERLHGANYIGMQLSTPVDL